MHAEGHGGWYRWVGGPADLGVEVAPDLEVIATFAWQKAELNSGARLSIMKPNIYYQSATPASACLQTADQAVVHLTSPKLAQVEPTGPRKCATAI